MTSEVDRTNSYRIAVGAEVRRDKEVPQCLQHKTKRLFQCINSEVYHFEETSTILQVR